LFFSPRKKPYLKGIAFGKNKINGES